jgi:hypothetical protein
LKGALCGPEVWNVEAYIAINDTNECNVGKIVPLCDHLSAYQDIYLFGSHLVKNRGVIFERPDGISIEFGDPCSREELRKLFEYTFCSSAALFEQRLCLEIAGGSWVFCSTAGAGNGRGRCESAKMAQKRICVSVVRESDAAVGTSYDLFATTTL